MLARSFVGDAARTRRWPRVAFASFLADVRDRLIPQNYRCLESAQMEARLTRWRICRRTAAILPKPRGVTPSLCLKCWVNELWSLNPHSAAMSLRGRSVVRNSRQAAATRVFMRNSCGVRLKTRRNCRCKARRERPHSVASASMVRRPPKSWRMRTTAGEDGEGGELPFADVRRAEHAHHADDPARVILERQLGDVRPVGRALRGRTTIRAVR